MRHSGLGRRSKRRKSHENYSVSQIYTLRFIIGKCDLHQQVSRGGTVIGRESRDMIGDGGVTESVHCDQIHQSTFGYHVPFHYNHNIKAQIQSVHTCHEKD
jgi:hypothetical protein